MLSLRSALLFLLTLAACKKPPPPPPAEPAPPASPCASGAGTVADPLSAAFFPAALDGWCIDPTGESRTYGDHGKLPLDAVCTTAFDGDCVQYTSLGLQRLVSLRYAEAGTGGRTVDVYLSRFADATGAFALFARRVVADSDPAEPTTPKPMHAGAAGALGVGRAYVLRDHYLLELQYNGEQESPEAVERSSAHVLPALAEPIGNRLPGGLDFPAAVRALPEEHRITSGLDLVPKDAWGVQGLGPLAVGFYAEGAVRYRHVAFVGDGESSAEAAWSRLRTRPGALPAHGLGAEAVRIKLVSPGRAEGPPREYVLVRVQQAILGVGDEDPVVHGLDAATEHPALTLEQKVTRLKAWIAKQYPESAGKK